MMNGRTMNPQKAIPAADIANDGTTYHPMRLRRRRSIAGAAIATKRRRRNSARCSVKVISTSSESAGAGTGTDESGGFGGSVSVDISEKVRRRAGRYCGGAGVWPGGLAGGCDAPPVGASADWPEGVDAREAASNSFFA